MPDTAEQCIDLLKGAGCKPKVIAHCRAVCNCAREYAKKTPLADTDLVVAGALLHDIGRGNTHSLGHAQRGAELLRGMKYPERLARIVECHTGAGLSADECTLLGLLPRDCMPRTIEEKIVTNADNLITGARRVTIEEELAGAIHLPRKIRKRMYHLFFEVELLTQ